MRRMTAEELYDTLLLVSGRFDETPYGAPEPVAVRDDGLVTPIDSEKGWRRSLYVAQRRSKMPTLFDSFDLPAMSPNCLQRDVSTVATQALHLMNNALVDRMAGAFAERVSGPVLIGVGAVLSLAAIIRYATVGKRTSSQMARVTSPK